MAAANETMVLLICRFVRCLVPATVRLCSIKFLRIIRIPLVIGRRLFRQTQIVLLEKLSACRVRTTSLIVTGTGCALFELRIILRTGALAVRVRRLALDDQIQLIVEHELVGCGEIVETFVQTAAHRLVTAQFIQIQVRRSHRLGQTEAVHVVHQIFDTDRRIQAGRTGGRAGDRGASSQFLWFVRHLIDRTTLRLFLADLLDEPIVIANVLLAAFFVLVVLNADRRLAGRGTAIDVAIDVIVDAIMLVRQSQIRVSICRR